LAFGLLTFDECKALVGEDLLFQVQNEFLGDNGSTIIENAKK